MKIKTQVSISLIVFVILAVLVIFSVYSSNNQLQEITKKQLIIDEIEKGSFELYYLENDYLLHGGTRPVEQWQSKYDELSWQLEELTITDPSQQAVFNTMSDNFKDLQTTFSSLLAVTGSVQETKTSFATQELKEFVTSTLTGQTQAIMFKSSELSEMMKAEAIQIQQRNTLIISASIAVLMIFVLLNYLVINRSVLRSISRLQKGTEIIGSGNLDAKIDEGSNDELGDLSLAFNTMTSNLKTVLTSKSELEKEIAERKRAEEALRTSEERFRIGATSVSDLIWDWDIIHGTLDWFGEIDKLFGYAPGKFPKTLEAWEQVIYPEDRDRVMATLEKHLKDRTPYIEEYRVIQKDGNIRYWTDRGSAMWDERGNAYRMIGACSDVTDRKLAEEELARSNRELQQFAYVSSHDLQEPLRMISSFVQLLEKRYKGKLDQDADEFIGYIVEGALRMQRMIQDLLTFSRVQTQGAEFARIETGQVFEKAVFNLRVLIEETGAVVTKDELPTVMGDETQLIQLFQNLIDNAIKFHRVEENPKVHISAQRKGNNWEFSVKDNGIGIDPRYFDRIFIIFQRLHSREAYEGTGIGLAVCIRIVERHGGRIWVESEPGRGSIFHFSLPAVN
jgi:PAS domain S-box-containing protein